MEGDKKDMISRCYNIINNAIQDPAGLPCRCKWKEDVGTIDEETWNLYLASAPLVSISASQKRSPLSAA